MHTTNDSATPPDYVSMFFGSMMPCQYIHIQPGLWKVVDDLEYPWYVLRSQDGGTYITKNVTHLDMWVKELSSQRSGSCEFADTCETKECPEKVSLCLLRYDFLSQRRVAAREKRLCA